MGLTTTPRCIFHGFAERAVCVRDLGTDALKWNVLGIKSCVLLNFFPVSLTGWTIVLSIKCTQGLEPIYVFLRDDIGKLSGSFTISATPIEKSGQLTGSPDTPVVMAPEESWSFVAFPLSGNAVIIERPGVYTLFEMTECGEVRIGDFYCALVEPEPLTAERIAAIKSDASAAKAARAQVTCQKCLDCVGVYVSLDRETMPADGYIWYENLPDKFICKCGDTQIDLTSMRRNFFALIGHMQTFRNDEFNLVPVYENNAISNLRIEFIKLLDSNPHEEAIQKFIENNTIFLHQFPAIRIFFKPRILTFFTADFAILTPQKELVLIEIELPTTRLLKKNGDHAAELTHAVNQVQNWMNVIEEHRLSVLASLKIDQASVGAIRGVVIAGRDSEYDTQYLRRLKSILSGKISLLTYDDISSSIAALQRQMSVL